MKHLPNLTSVQNLTSNWDWFLATKENDINVTKCGNAIAGNSKIQRVYQNMRI